MHYVCWAGRWTDTPSTGTTTRSFVNKWIPAIQAVILYLERKGKAKGTIDVTRKSLVEIAKRANLDNQEEVEIAIARYIKQNGKPCSNRWRAHL